MHNRKANISFEKDAHSAALHSHLSSCAFGGMKHMSIEEKAAKLAEYIRGLSDFRIVTEIDGNYGHLGATIADGVLQANMKYETHVRPRISRIRASFPTAATLLGLKKTLMQETTKLFLDWGGADRVKRFDDIVDLFSSEGIETEDDLRDWLLNERKLPKLATIKGVGPKTTDYFQILVGLQTCAIDRRLLDFLQQANVAVSGYHEARTIINLTADILGVKRAYLDHSIWEYIGKQGPKACKQRKTPNHRVHRIGGKGRRPPGEPWVR
jgi:hypothetical protein